MTLKDQWKTIKQNWLIAVVLLVLVLTPVFYGSGSVAGLAKSSYGRDYAVAEMAVARAPAMAFDEGFAPGVVERKITKTSSLSTEVERGEFPDAAAQLKAVVTVTDSYLLNENVNRYGEEFGYYSARYQIKVDAKKYDSVIGQLKQVGEVQSFNENAQDITEQHQDLTVELEAEKGRLTRFKAMLDKTVETESKIQLTDRIYDLERRISYLEDALKNVDMKVEYSTIYVTITEEQSGYANITFVKFSGLVRNLVNSFNGLLSLIFWIVPWAIVALFVWIGVKVVKKKN